MPVRHETEAVFDRWVREALQTRYAPALREPLPEALLRLLDATDREECTLGDGTGALERVR
jgi:hypothetical protein